MIDAASRGLVVGSVTLALAAGVWSVSNLPPLAGALLASFALAAVAARVSFGATARIILSGSFVAYGVTRLAVGPAVGAYPYVVLAAFAGLLVGGTPWAGWRTRGAWRMALAWWATGVALTWPVFAARDLGYSLVRSYAALPVIAAALLQMSAALWLDHLLGAPPARDGRPAAVRFFPAFVFSAVLTAVAAIYQRAVDITWLSGEPWVSLGRAPGLTGDANPMAVGTAVWAPIAVAFAPALGLRRWIGAAVGVVLVAGAWLSGARTALLLLAAGAAGLVLAFSGAPGGTRRARAAGLTGLALLAVGVLALGPHLPDSPVARLITSATGSSARGIAYEWLWRRDGYGLAAVEAIKERPWFGLGIGRFQAEAPRYYARLTGLTIPGDNAQNLWRQTLVEQGLVGLLPLVWLTALTARAVAAPPRRREDVVLRAMVVGLGAALTVGYPVQDVGVALSLATIVGASAYAGGSPDGRRSGSAGVAAPLPGAAPSASGLGGGT